MESVQLGRIEEKIDTLIAFRKDHETRIRTLEVLAAQASGGWKIIVALITAAGAVGAATSWALSHLKP